MAEKLRLRGVRATVEKFDTYQIYQDLPDATETVAHGGQTGLKVFNKKTYRNVRQHRAVLPAIARHLVYIIRLV